MFDFIPNVIVIELVDPDARGPVQGTKNSAGIDLFPRIPEPLLVKAGETMLIPTNVKIQLPIGIAGLLMPRSSTGRDGLELANTIGLIDHDFRGEIMACLCPREDQLLDPNKRFVQLFLVNTPNVVYTLGKVNETERGEGGFGSTGA